MKYKAKILSVIVLRLLRIRKTNGGKEKKRTHGGKHDIYALSSPLDFPKQWKRCTINREALSSYLCSVHHLLQWVQTNLAIWLSFPDILSNFGSFTVLTTHWYTSILQRWTTCPSYSACPINTYIHLSFSLFFWCPLLIVSCSWTWWMHSTTTMRLKFFTLLCVKIVLELVYHHV